MTWIESWELLLRELVGWVQLLLESISVLCVVLGLLKTLQLVAKIQRHRRRGDDFPFNQIRLQFGTWLALALEFQLGADVLATTVTPTLQDLTKLAIVAVVRTFLNYFLGRELEVEMELEHREQEHQAKMSRNYGGEIS